MSAASRIVIAGVGETTLGKHPGKSSFNLQAQAATLALKDAGLKVSDIDGVLNIYTRTDSYLMPSVAFAEYMGIHPRYSFTSVMGGAAGTANVEHAAMAIRSGLCNTVLITGGENRLTGISRDELVEKMAGIGHPDYENPYGPLIPAFYSLVASRYMHEYGTTREELASVAVTMRDHARLHPGAHMRGAMTIADVINSKPIASPLNMLDCCLISDGGGALIVTTEERARDLPCKPIAVLGFGEGHTHEHIMAAPSLTTFACKTSGETAYRMAGVTPADIDVAELYDCFTITVLIELEDLGFCAKGEAGAFFASGAARLGGKLPVNTHGGLLSHGQPGASGGLFHVLEAVHQLRHEAVGRQVEGAKLALVHGNAGILSGHCTLILGRD